MSIPDDPALLLPEGSVLLHIGPYKTGSTAIQSALFAVQDRLAEHGVAYPGRWRRALRPGYAVMRWAPRGRVVPPIEEWHAFCRDIAEMPDKRVCVSTEDFGSIRRTDRAREIVEGLGGDRVHVVYVARAFHRLLPSQWQERVKSYDPLTYEQWLRTVLDPTGRTEPDSTAHRNFWAAYDIEQVAAQWLPVVGPERFTVVVTDDSDRELIFRTFEGMLGLPAGMLALESEANASLTMNGTEVLRRVNMTFAEKQWPDRLYFDLMQRGLVEGLRAAPRASVDHPIPPLPAWAADRVAELSARRVEAIQRLGVTVVGDPECLLGREERTAPAEEYAPEVISVEMAAQGVAGVVEGVLKHLDHVEKQHRRALRAARQGAKGTAKGTAKGAAKGTAKGAAKGTAKGAKGTGKGAAKGAAEGAKGTLKDGSKGAAKGSGAGARSGRPVDQVPTRELVGIVARRARARVRRALARG